MKLFTEIVGYYVAFGMLWYIISFGPRFALDFLIRKDSRRRRPYLTVNGKPIHRKRRTEIVTVRIQQDDSPGQPGAASIQEAVPAADTLQAEGRNQPSLSDM